MTTNYNQLPTRLLQGTQELNVVAGGGMMGYGGVAVHELGGGEDGVSLYPETFTDRDAARGLVLLYDWVARIKVDEIVEWTNARLADAPSRRQDVNQAGRVELEVFDTEEMQALIDENHAALTALGLVALEK